MERFDDEPWQLWDLPLAKQHRRWLAFAILELYKRRDRFIEVLPLMMPYLGLVHKVGIRFRLRLHCAARVAAASPALLEMHSSAEAYAAVMHICRPEWH